MNKYRNTGLDTLRACAITLVFMYHYMAFVSRTPTFGWASEVGWVGVDLFFVLSGYLIANQLFAGLARGRTLSPARFYLRRALRTWPAFWVVLAAYFLFPAAMGGKTPPPLWRFLTFTQNFGLQPGTAFSHAWSLCLEEQFYFVLPLVLLIAMQLGRRRWQAWLFLAGLVAAGIAARAMLWPSYGLETNGQVSGYMSHLYYATLCRFDEFVPGVAVAMLKHLHPMLWRQLMRHGRAMLAAGLVATGAMLYGVLRFYYIDGYGYGFFMTALGYSLLPMAFALLVVAALSPASPLHHVRIPGAYQLALWSYSIYLTHKPVGNIVRNFMEQAGAAPSMTVAATTAMSLLVGASLYYLVERPLMMLRDRIAPSNFTAGEPARYGSATIATEISAERH